MSRQILKKFILEAIRELEELDQDTVPPGKWAANTGEPADEEDLERLGEDELYLISCLHKFLEDLFMNQYCQRLVKNLNKSNCQMQI